MELLKLRHFVCGSVYFPSRWLLSHINPRKKNIDQAGGSNQRPPVLRSSTLPTELHGLGTEAVKMGLNDICQKYRPGSALADRLGRPWVHFSELCTHEICVRS